MYSFPDYYRDYYRVLAILAIRSHFRASSAKQRTIANRECIRFARMRRERERERESRISFRAISFDYPKSPGIVSIIYIDYLYRDIFCRDSR